MHLDEKKFHSYMCGMTTIGETIRALRENAGESLSHAAAQIGCTKPHLWELERGLADNPTLKMLRRISAHYGVPVSKIIGET